MFSSGLHVRASFYDLTPLLWDICVELVFHLCAPRIAPLPTQSRTPRLGPQNPKTDTLTDMLRQYNNCGPQPYKIVENATSHAPYLHGVALQTVGY